MKKAVKAMLATAAVVSISAGVSLTPAYADDADVVTRAARGLSSYQVFQIADTELTDGQTLATKLRGSDLGVVVVPQDDVESMSAQEIASNVRDSQDVRYSTVIAVIDGKVDTLGVSSEKQEVQDRIESYLGDSTVNDAGWVLIQNSSNISNVEETLRSEAEQKAKDAEMKSNLKKNTSLFLQLLPLMAIFSLVVATISVVVKKTIGSADKNSPLQYGFKKLPKKLREAVDEFRKTADLHKDLKRYSLHKECSLLISRFIQLEDVMIKLGVDDQRRMILEVEYIDRLEKLTEAIGKSYYLSIVDDPTHWDAPDAKIKRVKAAVIALCEQVLESIKQINDSSTLEFNIALDSIIGDKRVKVEDLYNK